MEDRVWLVQNYPELFEFAINTCHSPDVHIPWSAIRYDIEGIESTPREQKKKITDRFLQACQDARVAPNPQDIAGPSNWYKNAIPPDMNSTFNNYFQCVASAAMIATGEHEMVQRAPEVRNMTLNELFEDPIAAPLALRAVDCYEPDNGPITVADCCFLGDKLEEAVSEMGCERPKKMARLF